MILCFATDFIRNLCKTQTQSEKPMWDKNDCWLYEKSSHQWHEQRDSNLMTWSRFHVSNRIITGASRRIVCPQPSGVLVKSIRMFIKTNLVRNMDKKCCVNVYSHISSVNDVTQMVLINNIRRVLFRVLLSQAKTKYK